MKASRIAVLSTVVATAALPVHSASGDTGPGDPPLLGQEELNKNPANTDAAAYALMWNISELEAERRLNRQDSIVSQLERVRALPLSSLAGTWVEHSRSGVVGVVGLVGLEDVELIDDELVNESPLIEVRTDLEHTLPTLHSRLAEVKDHLQKRGYITVASGLNKSQGAVVLYVEESTKESVDLDRDLAELRASSTVPIKVELMPAAYEDQTDVRGGGGMKNVGGIGCTSGFTVQNSVGTKGVLTAGHCAGIQQYQPPSGSVVSLTFQNENLTTSADFEWHSAPSVVPEFYASSTTQARTTSAVQPWTSQEEGTTVCHRGNGSGYSCGTIQDKTWAPPQNDFNCGPSGNPCDNTFVLVAHQTTLKCAATDSGGPWFLSTKAYGGHKGGYSSGAGAGQCFAAVYSPLDNKGMGVTVLTG